MLFRSVTMLRPGFFTENLFDDWMDDFEKEFRGIDRKLYGKRAGRKICILLSGGPKVVQPSNCLIIHPIAIFSFLTVLALVHPLGYLKEAVGSQLLTVGPFAVECHLD